MKQTNKTKQTIDQNEMAQDPTNNAEDDENGSKVVAAKRQGRRVSQFGAHELMSLKQVFSWIDKDKNGSVEPDEIAEVLQKFGFQLSKDEISDIMADLDKNGDGVMDFEEFATLMDRRMSINSHRSEIHDTFKVFDKDQDGKISFQDLKETLQQLGEDVTDNDVRDMIKEFDFKKDGVIDLEEFMFMMAANEDEATKTGLLQIGGNDGKN